MGREITVGPRTMSCQNAKLSCQILTAVAIHCFPPPYFTLFLFTSQNVISSLKFDVPLKMFLSILIGRKSCQGKGQFCDCTLKMSYLNRTANYCRTSDNVRLNLANVRAKVILIGHWSDHKKNCHIIHFFAVTKYD